MTAEEKRKAKEEIRAKNIAAFEKFKKENPDWEKSSTKDAFEKLINSPEEYSDRVHPGKGTSEYLDNDLSIYNTNRPVPKTEEQKEEERVEREINSLRQLNQKRKEVGLGRKDSWRYQNLLGKYGDPDTWQDENLNDDYDDVEDEDVYYDEEDDWEEEGHEDDDWEDYEDDVDESNYDPYMGQDVYDEGSWFEESKRYHEHLRESENFTSKKVKACKEAAQKLLDEGNVWTIESGRDAIYDFINCNNHSTSDLYDWLVLNPLFFKSEKEAENYIEKNRQDLNYAGFWAENVDYIFQYLISGEYDDEIEKNVKKDNDESEEKKDRDYYRNLYLSDPIDKSADFGNVHYIGDELGVPQYESAKRSNHWFEKLEKHLQEAQASDETFKKFWDLAEEEYGIK